MLPVHMHMHGVCRVCRVCRVCARDGCAGSGVAAVTRQRNPRTVCVCVCVCVCGAVARPTLHKQSQSGGASPSELSAGVWEPRDAKIV